LIGEVHVRQCCYIVLLVPFLLATAVAAQTDAEGTVEATGSLVIQSCYAPIGYEFADLPLAGTCYPGEKHVHAELPAGVFEVQLWGVRCELAIQAGKTCYLVAGADRDHSTVKYAEGKMTEPVHAETLVTRLVGGFEYRYRVRIPATLADEIDAAPYDRVPVPVEWIPAEWSEQAVRAGLHCDVTALVRVEPDGTVSRVHSLIEVPVLRDTVAQLPDELIFMPASRGGEPVAGWVFMTLWFAERWRKPEALLSCWRPGDAGPSN